jgi:hypothetical protein
MSAPRTFGAVATAVALGATPLAAQQPTFRDSLLDRFVGRWVLRGTIDGAATTHDVAAEWVLGHQYVRVHEVAREKDGKGEPAYQADVYIGWDPAAQQYVCIWLDTFGGITSQSIGRATRAANDIPFVFTELDGGGTFHTTFAYLPETDSWIWRMDAVRKSATTLFARVALTRQ